MKLTQKEIAKAKPNPIFKGLPAKLKDVSIFISTERQLLRTLKSTHKHKSVKAYANCEKCQAKRTKRLELMKELGFKSFEQYQEWRKVMSIIHNQKDFQIK